MIGIIPGLILSFREALEALLIIMIISKFLNSSGQTHLKSALWVGVGFGLVFSLVLGLAFSLIPGRLSGGLGSTLWEGFASLLAMLLVTTFIVWMIRHGHTISSEIKAAINQDLRPWPIMILAAIMVSREGAEIVIFSFAAAYPWYALLAGISLAGVLVFLMLRQVFRINLGVLFSTTLVYLVLQSAYLLGAGIHELLEAGETIGFYLPDSFFMTKAWDLSATVFDNQTGLVGVALQVLLGWNSNPEIIPALVQLAYLAIIGGWWFYRTRRPAAAIRPT